jgi:hypothetical protein
MRRSSESGERTQTTVAELLARYGEPAPTTGGRRRRAEPELDTVEDTVAQPVIPPPTWPPSAPEKPAAKPKLSSLPNWAPAVSSPGPRTSALASSSAFATPAPLATRTLPPDGGVTEQLPRYDPAPAGPAPRLGGQPIRSAPPSAVSAQFPAGLGTTTCDLLEQDEAASDDIETEEPQPRPPLWEWAAMVSQVGLGVVGGATLWLICEWLWQHIPVVALAVALAVITGLVWIVRRVRRAEDLQTTVIAVLVGLFVTVSPAALLLVGR